MVSGGRNCPGKRTSIPKLGSVASSWENRVCKKPPQTHWARVLHTQGSSTKTRWSRAMLWEEQIMTLTLIRAINWFGSADWSSLQRDVKGSKTRHISQWSKLSLVFNRIHCHGCQWIPTYLLQHIPWLLFAWMPCCENVLTRGMAQLHNTHIGSAESPNTEHFHECSVACSAIKLPSAHPRHISCRQGDGLETIWKRDSALGRSSVSRSFTQPKTVGAEEDSSIDLSASLGRAWQGLVATRQTSWAWTSSLPINIQIHIACLMIAVVSCLPNEIPTA